MYHDNTFIAPTDGELLARLSNKVQSYVRTDNDKNKDDVDDNNTGDDDGWWWW